MATTRTLVCLLIGLLAAAGGADTTFDLERNTAADLNALLARARKDGFSREAIAIRAGHRPAAEKHSLASEVIRAFGAEELTRWIGARSEHITGKSVDLDLGVAPTIANAQAGAFENLPAYRWLRLHAREFGFNQAFPGEPWHFTHYLPPGSVEGPAVGTVGPGRFGTVVRRAPDLRPADAVVQVLTGAAVAWLPEASTIAYTQCWREEGGGDGCVVKWERRRDRKVTRTIRVFLPGDADTEDTRRSRIIQARNAIGSLLNGASLLPASTWGDGARSVSVGTRQQLSWDAERSALSLSGKSRNNVKQLAPWVARPIWIYANRDVDFVMVELVYDPQEPFTKGANLVSRFEVVDGVSPGLGRNWRGGLPADVIDFVQRYGGCNHWAGEEPYSDERRKEIENGVKQLGCDRLDADERMLRSKYAGKAKILGAIEAASTFDGD